MKIVINKNWLTHSYYFSIEGRNGKALATSRPYTRKDNCITGFKRMFSLFKDSPIEYVDLTGE